MSKKQQAKLKRQFSYLKRQFKEAGVDLSDMKFEDLKQKSYKTLNRMRAELLKTSKVFGEKNITVTRNDKIIVNGETKLEGINTKNIILKTEKYQDLNTWFKIKKKFLQSTET